MPAACLIQLPTTVEGEGGVIFAHEETKEPILTRREWRQLDARDFGPLSKFILDSEKLRRKGYDEAEISRLSELLEAARELIHHNDGITAAEMDVFLSGMVPYLGEKEYEALFDLGILEGIISDLYLGDVITISIHTESIYFEKETKG